MLCGTVCFEWRFWAIGCFQLADTMEKRVEEPLVLSGAVFSFTSACRQEGNRSGKLLPNLNQYLLYFRVQHGSWSLENRIKVFLSFLFWIAFLQELVDRDNSKFEEWCVEMAEMRKQSVDKGKAKHEEVKELYQRLPAGAGL